MSTTALKIRKKKVQVRSHIPFQVERRNCPPNKSKEDPKETSMKHGTRTHPRVTMEHVKGLGRSNVAEINLTS